MVTLYRRFVIKGLPGQSSVADMHRQTPPEEQWVRKRAWGYYSVSNSYFDMTKISYNLLARNLSVP